MAGLDVLFDEFHNPDLQEVLVNGNRSLQRIFRGYRDQTSSPFQSCKHLTNSLQQFAHEQSRRLDPLHPSAGGAFRHSCGWQLRWHFVIPPVSREGPVASFRRHQFTTLNLEDFAGAVADKAELEAIIKARQQPVFIAGPTGAGKTSLLISLLAAWASEDRVIFFEETEEVPQLFPVWVHFSEREARPDGLGAIPLSRLVREALRLRPDRLVLGELRGSEGDALFYLLHSGHGAVYTTLHLGAPSQLLPKLAQAIPDLRIELQATLRELEPVVVMMERGMPPKIKGLSTPLKI